MIQYKCFDYAHFIISSTDPVPNPDGHYKKFEEVYGEETSEKHRPSLAPKSGVLTEKEAGFRVSGETLRKVVYCEECDKPRWVFVFFCGNFTTIILLDLCTIFVCLLLKVLVCQEETD